MKPIIVEHKFDTPVSKIWNAITVLSEMKQWYFAVIPAFEPKVGFQTNFTVQVEDRVYPHQWTITEVIPQKKIAYEWRFQGYPGLGLSEFELFEENNKTRLQLTFTVIEKFPDHLPEFKRQSGLDGWNYFIKESLPNYINGSE